MSRTNDSPFWSRLGVARIVFCVLICCLAIHFLVEDALLLAEFTSLNPAAAGTSHANCEEFEHLDDLVYTERLTGDLMGSGGSAIFLWIVPFIRQARSSIFIPPKS
jgi:hypothetical protein